MVSVQRCLKLLEVPQEREMPPSLAEDAAVNQDLEGWPSQGAIAFNEVKLRYRAKTELVLKGLSFEVQGGLKIGIVGRTGAGKSTISLALTRIVEIESGSIIIDGINISEIDLHKLR